MNVSPSSSAHAVARARAYFVSPPGWTRARSLDPATRTSLERAVSLLRQKRGAAEALMSADCTAEAVRLIHVAAAVAADILRRVSNRTDDNGATLPADAEEQLVNWGASPHDAARVGKALRDALGEPNTPDYDDAIQQTHIDRYEAIVGACRAVERLFEWTARTSIERAGVLALRWAPIAVLSLIVGSLLAPGKGMHVTASATYDSSDRFAADHVSDGNPSTEWLLPDRTPGWVDIEWRSSRNVNSVRVLDAHNPPYNDRAARNVVVDLYSGTTLAASAHAELPPVSGAPAWTNVPVRASRVTRVRVTVNSWDGLGGGLAEVEVQ